MECDTNTVDKRRNDTWVFENVLGKKDFRMDTFAQRSTKDGNIPK